MGDIKLIKDNKNVIGAKIRVIIGFIESRKRQREKNTCIKIIREKIDIKSNQFT